ncbi:MAG: hypothetical protein IJ411_03220 [Oscillospiraceae bacterium]|nr:hypothetical protein [Oscillospiraceae bacterium]
MGGSIFFLDENERVIELKEARYESEDLFQRLIEQYPNILAGDQITPEQPRKWLFVSREMGVPECDGGNAQWFLDHLFIDQDSVPTLVEVKRSSDTRIRREVVAQMLDYAANASAYWPVSKLREVYETHCQETEVSPLEELGLSPEDSDNFWDKVHNNLRLGKLRLLFVADEIPDSLRRIIEFLNEQMIDTEVLGIEIKQYVSGQNQRTLVPKIIGQTANAEQVKQSSPSFSWNEELFLERVTKISGKPTADICQKILRSFEEIGCQIYWGKGQYQAGFTPLYEGKVTHYLCAVYSYEKSTKIELSFQHFKAPFNTEEKQLELMQRFSDALGFQLPKSKIFKRPSFNCDVLADDKKFSNFIAVYKDMLKETLEYENNF